MEAAIGFLLQTMERWHLEDEPVHFDEFKMYLDSAEKTTDRRLDLNKTNASLALLILAGLGAIMSWSYQKPEIKAIATLAVLLVSLLAVLFCRWWWQQIVSYKELNSAKSTVLNDMAKRLVFASNGSSVRSHLPFEKEWAILQENRSLSKFGKGYALGASLSEVTVPISFLFAFCMILTCSSVLVVTRHYYTALLFWHTP